MDAIHSNVTPAYRGIQTQPQRTGLLAGLGSLVGCGPAPVYKTADGGSVQALAPCPWWCRLSVTPKYKTAGPRLEEIDIDLDAVDPGNGDADAPPPESTAPATVVIL